MIYFLGASIVLNVWLWIEVREANRRVYEEWKKYKELQLQSMVKQQKGKNK